MMYFVYGLDGISGFTINNQNYYYKKNLQGDIIGIYDNNFNLIVKYEYDAWGEHKIYYLDNGNFVDFDSDSTYTNISNTNLYIALKNPFRYRGYYYDSETGLYYLNSRYYDSEIGRFINADDISVLDITNIALNGINLYAYCLNNPVNEVDESGYFLFWLFVTAIVVGAVAGGVSKGVEAYKEGVRGWELFGSILGGAIMGGAMGAVLTIGGVAGLGAFTGTSLLGISTGAALSLSLAIGVTAGMASYFVEAAFREDIQWNALDFGLAGLSGGFQAATTFAISFIAGKDLGAFDKVLINDLIKGIPQVGRDFAYSVVKVMFGRKNFLTQIGEIFLKSGIVSGLSSLVRSLFDNVLNRNG